MRIFSCELYSSIYLFQPGIDYFFTDAFLSIRSLFLKDDMRVYESTRIKVKSQVFIKQ